MLKPTLKRLRASFRRIASIASGKEFPPKDLSTEALVACLRREVRP
jgi:hypothetical protein